MAFWARVQNKPWPRGQQLCGVGLAHEQGKKAMEDRKKKGQQRPQNMGNLAGKSEASSSSALYRRPSKDSISTAMLRNGIAYMNHMKAEVDTP